MSGTIETIEIDNTEKNKKVKLGQFFTKESSWLKPQVADFILNCGCSIAYDPYAGAGDLLNVAKSKLGFKTVKGLDIDSTLSWEINDSLLNIPHVDDAIIITNPPYIAKQSASRKKIDLNKYFVNSIYDDVYLVALHKMLLAQKNVVAIIPESFINSNFLEKEKINSITILEENPFLDTENPVCVVCFDSIPKSYKNIKIYKNDDYVSDLESILDVRIEPKHIVKIVFNTLDGWLGLRAIDSTDDKTFICFDFKDNFDYDWQKNIKVSSRHFSLIDIPVSENNKKAFISKCNQIINELRSKSYDIIFTPFKGNTKKGRRRRRLDFRLARAIMERAYIEVEKGETYYEELTLFSI